MSGLPDLFVRNGRIRVRQVVPHRVRKEHGVLQHDADPAAELRERNTADVPAIQQDFTAVDIVEAHQQVDDRRLAAARRADERDLPAGLDCEREVVDDTLLRHIGEVYVAELDAAVKALRPVCGVRPDHGLLFIFVEDCEDTLRAGDRRFDLTVELRDLVDRPRELL